MCKKKYMLEEKNILWMYLVFIQYISVSRSNRLDLGRQNKMRDAEVEKGMFGGENDNNDNSDSVW